MTGVYTLSLHDALPISCGTRSPHPHERECECSDPVPGSAPRSREGFARDRKSTRLNSSHPSISYAVFCLKKKNYFHDTGLILIKTQTRQHSPVPAVLTA